MAEGKRTPGFCQPMVGTWADPGKVKCMDCGLRNRTVVKSADGRKDVPVGATRRFCDAYPSGKGKPNEILFQNADCEFYVKD